MINEIYKGHEISFKSETKQLNNEIELKKVLTRYGFINAQVAARVRESILEKHAFGWEPNSEDRKMFADFLDRKATDIMEIGLHDADFISEVMPNGCEGAKENRKAFELGLGPTDLPVLDGPYGKGSAVAFKDRFSLPREESKVKLIIDPIEGTTKASLNLDGSVAIIAGTINGNIASIPSEDSNALYADRLVASSRLKGKVSFANSVKSNIYAVMNEYNISDPREIQVVVMNRERNRKLIQDLTKERVSLNLIDSGDLMPAISALTKDKPMLSMGSGGKQEAIIAGCAAKAMGGVFELQYVSKNGETVNEYPDILNIDDVLSGRKNDYFVNFASITGVKELGLKAPQRTGSNWMVNVALISGESPKLKVENLFI